MLTRPATAADAAAIVALQAEVHQMHVAAEPGFFKPLTEMSFSPAAYQELLEKPDHAWWVAEVDGQVVGYLYAEVRHLPENAYRFAIHDVYVHQIGVRAEQRRHGAGAALLAAVKALARQVGARWVGLDVWAFNQRGQAFFASQGLTPFNHRLWFKLDPTEGEPS